MKKFKLISTYKPKGDQPKAISSLSRLIKQGKRHQTLLGVTGSGKTYTIAKVIENVQKPTLVISHNKTLAAQLYNEFKAFFPKNRVEYFVSYYDYYQPEAYIPQTDTYIEKDASINDEIDRLRHSATSSVLTRNDTIIVASVSCIYGIGSPENYKSMYIHLNKNLIIDRDDIIKKFVKMQYARNDNDIQRGRFRVRGESIDIFPSSYDTGIRIILSEDRINSIYEIDLLTNKPTQKLNEITIYPAGHWVTPSDKLEKAIATIEEELHTILKKMHRENKLVEAQRLEQRTRFDIEMLREIGYCKGIENYSRHLDGRKKGEPPYTLMDYLPKNSLVIIDESHVTIPQIRGMYEGDMARKKTLIEYGFRLPSALDNRPLYFEEFFQKVQQVVYVSATPSDYEINVSKNRIIEQIIRPTGLIDPQVIIKPAKNQVDDLIGEIKQTVEKENRVLVTTLTKRMAEDLCEYLKDLGFKTKYLHSDIETLERVKIIRDLRAGIFDVLVGINLLREGLDLPEVALVAILDADKEGFLRSETTLIQTIGRAARNISSRAILYADKLTNSIRRAVSETNRRRKIQNEYNRKHNITPESIKKTINDALSSIYEHDYYTVPAVSEKEGVYIPPDEIPKLISKLEIDMRKSAEKLHFEEAAEIRDRIKTLKKTYKYSSDILPAKDEISKIERKHKTRRLAREKSRRLYKK